MQESHFIIRYRTEELNQAIENFTKSEDWTVKTNDPQGYTFLHLAQLGEIKNLMKVLSKSYNFCMFVAEGKRYFNVPATSIETNEMRTFIVEYTAESTFKVII
jgi:hypothetical protein